MMGLLSKINIFNRERMMERVFRVGQEKLKYIERKLTRYLYVLLYPFQQKNRLNCEVVLPVYFQIFYYNLEQFCTEMRRKHTTFLL